LRARALQVANCAQLHASRDRITRNPDDLSSKTALEAVKSRLARAGVDAVLVEMTRTDLKIPAMRAIAPKLRVLWDRNSEHRWCDPAEGFGGRRLVTGIPLL
jgi:ribosomal protein S12 methylthiotransferase accessory factor YcaO